MSEQHVSKTTLHFCSVHMTHFKQEPQPNIYIFLIHLLFFFLIHVFHIFAPQHVKAIILHICTSTYSVCNHMHTSAHAKHTHTRTHTHLQTYKCVYCNYSAVCCQTNALHLLWEEGEFKGVNIC